MSSDGGDTSKIFMHGGIRDAYISAIGGKCGDDKQPHTFSFKGDIEKNSKLSTQIYTFPSELSAFLTNDSGCKEISSLSNYDAFIDQVPYLEIRAYAPDIVLQYAMNIAETIAAGVSKGWNSSWEEIETELAEKWNMTKTAVGDFFNGLFTKGGISTFFEAASKNFGNNFKFRQTTGENSETSKHDLAILDFPWNMYYRLMGSTTNVVYRIPCQFPNNFLNSNGSYGWSNANIGYYSDLKKLYTHNKNPKKNKDDDNSNSDSNNKSKDKKSLMSTVFSQIFTNFSQKFGISIMPFFSPGNSKNDSNMAFTITFDLINDTFDHANANHAFVQTLIANNKWLQYMFFTYPSNLYDVRIPGGYRLFMCTGNFSVKYKGVIKKSKKPLGIFGDETRIPEAYSVSMTFTSLLPDNFNTHMMGILKANEEVLTVVTDGRTSPGVLKNITKTLQESASALAKFGSIERIQNEEFERIQDENFKHIQHISQRNLDVNNFAYSETYLGILNETERNALNIEIENFAKGEIQKIYKSELDKDPEKYKTYEERNELYKASIDKYRETEEYSVKHKELNKKYFENAKKRLEEHIKNMEIKNKNQ